MKTGVFSISAQIAMGVAVMTLSIFSVRSYCQTPDPNFFVFIAFGQSNMEGFPGVEASDKTGVSTRFQLLPALDWPDGSRKKGTWTTAVPPLCRGDGPGLNPCDYFGRTLVDSLPSNIKIGIINISLAGCKIEMFDNNKYQTYINSLATTDYLRGYATKYGGNPYARLVEMGKAAQKDGVIKGILLHQGESGTMPGNTWEDEVKTIYNDLIKDLSLDATKTPLLAGEMLYANKGGSCGGFNTTIAKLPGKLPNSYVVSADGISGRDQFHFTAQGYRDFGKRYGIKMLDVLRKQGSIVATTNKKGTGTSTDSYDMQYISSNLLFEIPQQTNVTLRAYTLGGKELVELVNTEYAAGKHSIRLDQNIMPKGVYVVKMRAGRFSATRTICTGSK
jgi:hypothetical protein